MSEPHSNQTNEDDNEQIIDVTENDIVKIRNGKHIQTVRVTDVLETTGNQYKFEASVLETTRNLTEDELPPTVTAHAKQITERVDENTKI